ncbi:YceI family protein [Thermaurantiacus sp.]
MRRLALLAALGLAACSPAPTAEQARPADVAGKAWALVPAESRLSFVSVKAGEVAEVHHFHELSGNVAADGTARIEIPLDSVETGIDIRDERMRKFLFETGLFPKATVTAAIDLAAFQDLGVGDQRRLPLSGELSLHGVTAPIEAQVAVTRTAPGKVLVATVDPIVVNAATFGMEKGVAELMKLANLNIIAPDAPVTFQLTFAVES